MYNRLLILIVFFTFLHAEESFSKSKVFQIGKEHNKNIILKREIKPKCKQLPITNNMFWEGSYASDEVPDECKATFITSAGQNISPMRLHKMIDTFGEMEVLAFIEEMQEDDTLLLIDTRDEEWYEYNTIPGAINIHYLYILMDKTFPQEYRASLAKLGIHFKQSSFDFSNAKTILLFCNGSWCSSSSKMIKALLALGYPPHKIKWYRGGMDDWLGLSLTTTRNR